MSDESSMNELFISDLRVTEYYFGIIPNELNPCYVQEFAPPFAKGGANSSSTPLVAIDNT